ncbi:MAG: YkgJ family cysteine cluster protein [Planctomycetes bacterium]|nr:YkgJ family cysteine cluster protein [Planctomycetota bacterium]
MTANRRILAASDRLPLTCTRSGTCCHGKDVRITPWELARLADAAGEAQAAFRDRCTTDGGTRLAMHGPPGWRGQRACALYDPASGCRLHAARPLACRLYPLGREVQGGRERIIHEGRAFPCLDGCPEVAQLPALQVSAYLEGQGVAAWVPGRDAYLEIAQDLAEGAFVLVFDSGLSRSGDASWRARWRSVAQGGPPAWLAALGASWHDRLTVPAVEAPLADGAAWSAAHAAALQAEAQSSFARLGDAHALASASACMLAGALLLIHAVGGDAAAVGMRWLGQAVARA